jgi:hypothetical protein
MSWNWRVPGRVFGWGSVLPVYLRGLVTIHAPQGFVAGVRDNQDTTQQDADQQGYRLHLNGGPEIQATRL